MSELDEYSYIYEKTYKKCYWKAVWVYTLAYILIACIYTLVSAAKDDIIIRIPIIIFSSFFIPITSLTFYPIIYFVLFPFYRAFVKDIDLEHHPSLTEHLFFGLLLSGVPLILLGIIFPPFLLLFPPMPFAGIAGGYTLYKFHKKGHEIETSRPF